MTRVPGIFWKGALFAALLAATWLFLTPAPPAPPPAVPYLDKLAHLGVFAALALLAARAYPTHPRAGVFAALLLYGLAIEVAQPRTGRAFELLDLAADALGAAAVWLAPRRAA